MVQLPNPAHNLWVRGTASCITDSGENALCWGRTVWPNRASYSQPVPKDPFDPFDAGASVANIAIGGNHLCTLSLAGTIACVGYNDWGQLGYPAAGDELGKDLGSPYNFSATLDTVPSLFGATAIGASATNSCVVLCDGNIRCWGAKETWLTGKGAASPENRRMLPERLERPNAVRQVELAGTYACAMLQDESAVCWGWLPIGSASMPWHYVYPPRAIDNWRGILAWSLADDAACAVKNDGTVSCFGRNRRAILGTGIPDDDAHPAPVPIEGITSAVDISVGPLGACVVEADGRVRCWGDDYRAISGRSDMTRQFFPPVEPMWQ
jgi:alpha-tubulin suppressor-like RCC1 family protein